MTLGAYVGAGAHGRNSFYCYYVCRAQYGTGNRACRGSRVRADHLEEAVIDALVAAYDDLDLFERAIDRAVEEVDRQQPQLADELASVEAQIRDTTAAIDRYLRAFESGTMPDTVCAPRLEELSERRQKLSDYRDELAARVNANHHYARPAATRSRQRPRPPTPQQ